jgi:hypothetical protein
MIGETIASYFITAKFTFPAVNASSIVAELLQQFHLK